MASILAGIETEYGLLVEGRGASSQVEDSMALVRDYPDECHAVWDYRNESPRNDLRGFRLDRLQFDPVDAQFDVGKTYGPDKDVRADRILPNGARLYNDHGHPEYSTPECWTLSDLVQHDLAGQIVVARAANAYSSRTGQGVSIYKNNTDFHGSSYGTHESYTVPRSIEIARLAATIIPILIARQVVSGAGKVGSESGAAAKFQISQRADFFMEPINAETLYRRPIFNTRDEPHADPTNWIRMHVISGDANMIGSCTSRKVGLVKIALQLLIEGEAPLWRLKDPVASFQSVSRDMSYGFRIELEGGSWTTAREIAMSYIEAARATVNLDKELTQVANETEQLFEDLNSNFDRFRRSVDWAAKYQMLLGVGADWSDPILRAYDLEYHNIDPEVGLHGALEAMGEVDQNPREIDALISTPPVGSRAMARGTAIHRFAESVITASWRSIVMRNSAGNVVEIELDPNRWYDSHINDAPDVDTFIKMIQGAQ